MGRGVWSGFSIEIIRIEIFVVLDFKVMIWCVFFFFGVIIEDFG